MSTTATRCAACDANLDYCAHTESDHNCRLFPCRGMANGIHVREGVDLVYNRGDYTVSGEGELRCDAITERPGNPRGDLGCGAVVARSIARDLLSGEFDRSQIDRLIARHCRDAHPMPAAPRYSASDLANGLDN